MSDILIRGMEMPKDKAVAVVIHPDGTAYTAEMIAGVCTEYLSDCTAVPVPPHGRLIDADALVRDNGIKEIPEYYEVVRDAPTIIPAEED